MERTMTPKVITPPAAALDLPALRLHCKIDLIGGSHPDDTVLTAALDGARRYAEHYTQTSIGEQTLELALDAFPVSWITLPRGPVTSITSVKYLDQAGGLQTLDPGAYKLDTYQTPARLFPAFGTSWPSTRCEVNAVLIRYVAGAVTAEIDQAVISALKLIVGHLYENREDSTPGTINNIPLGADALLDTVRVWSM